MGIDRADIFIGSLDLEAYRVGGSVRDEILGRKPKDADYVVRGADLKTLGRHLTFAARTYARADSRRGPFTIKPLVLRDGRQAGWRLSAKGLGCIEIVLPRTEVSTGPGHRDFKIVLDPNLPLEEDAKRRDFTFNALYKIMWHPDGLSTLVAGPGGIAYEDILDPTGLGLNDLARKTINVTHPDSFRDDPLRMLRALRFMSTLGYDLGPETRALMAIHADNVLGLWSKARPCTSQEVMPNGLTAQKKRIPGDHATKSHLSGTVLQEFSKLLMGAKPAKALRAARDTGVLAAALPELAPMLGFEQGSRYHDMTIDEHTFTALETAAHMDASLRVRWALLFHDAGKPETAWVGADGRNHYYEPSDKVWFGTPQMAGLGDNGINGMEKPRDHELVGAEIWLRTAEALQVDKRLRDDVATLIRHHMVSAQKLNKTKVRRARIRLGDDLLSDLYLMRMCDLSGKGGKNLSFLENVGLMELERAGCALREVPCKVTDLQINGNDLKALGAEGRAIGRALNIVLDEVACDPSLLKRSREWQLKRAEAAING